MSPARGNLAAGRPGPSVRAPPRAGRRHGSDYAALTGAAHYVHPQLQLLLALAMRRRGVHDVATSDSTTRSRVRRAAFAGMFNVAEVMAMRPEDRNARQVQQAFANGATLAELEQHLAFLRSLGAPDDAHPRVGVNEDYEVTMMICVVRRPTLQASSPS